MSIHLVEIQMMNEGQSGALAKHLLTFLESTNHLLDTFCRPTTNNYVSVDVGLAGMIEQKRPQRSYCYQHSPVFAYSEVKDNYN